MQEIKEIEEKFINIARYYNFSKRNRTYINTNSAAHLDAQIEKELAALKKYKREDNYKEGIKRLKGGLQYGFGSINSSRTKPRWETSDTIVVREKRPAKSIIDKKKPKAQENKDYFRLEKIKLEVGPERDYSFISVFEQQHIPIRTLRNKTKKTDLQLTACKLSRVLYEKKYEQYSSNPYSNNPDNRSFRNYINQKLVQNPNESEMANFSTQLRLTTPISNTKTEPLNNIEYEANNLDSNVILINLRIPIQLLNPKH